MVESSSVTVYRPGRSVRSAAGFHAARTLVGLLVGGVTAYVVWLLAPDLGAVMTLALVWLPLILYSAFKRSWVASFTRAQKEASAWLHRDQPARAERELAAVQARYPWPRVLRRLAGYDRALALTRLGRHDDAVAVLAEVDRKGGAIGVDSAIASNLAYVHALRGDAELAATWLEEARDRDQLGIVSGATLPHILAETALDLRRGNFREVQLRLDAQWTEIENTLTGERMIPLRVFRAFAVAQLSAPREAGTLTPLLAALRGVHLEQVAYLATSWPELEQFLQTNLQA